MSQYKDFFKIEYKTDLIGAFKRVEDAFDDVDAAIEERLDSMIPLKLLNDELKAILKSVIKNDGKMTAGQIDAVNRYLDWEAR